QNQQGCFHLADNLVLERHGDNHRIQSIRIVITVRGCEVLDEARQLSVRLRGRNALLEPPDRAEVVKAHLLWIQPDRNPQRSLRWKIEIGWRDADNLRGKVIEVERSANHPRIAAEAPLPKAIAQDTNQILTRRAFLRHKGASVEHLLFEDTEEIYGHIRAFQPLWFARIRQIESGPGIGCEGLEALRLIAVKREVRLCQ